MEELKEFGVEKNLISIDNNNIIRQTNHGKDECAKMPKQGGSEVIK